MFEGIIFELDGLMIDSEPVQIEAWNEYLKRFELQVSENELASLLGRRVYDAGEYLRRRYNIPTDPFTMFEERQAIYLEMIKDNIVAMPGLIDTLQMLKDYEYKLAVTCTGPREYIYLVTDTLGIEEAFDVIVAGDMVSEGYPNPTMLNACAETFALHPSYCLSITCRREGVEAAQEAQMRTICIPGYSTPRWRIAGADLVLPSLSQINIPVLRSLWRDVSDEPRLQPYTSPARY